MEHEEAFRFFTKLVYENAGITLDDSKLYLVETRLASMCREQECANITELHEKLRFGVPETVRRDIVEALTTNETWWFRDAGFFDALKTKIWPSLIEQRLKEGKSSLNIWCAATSTGQEPYSIRITWEEGSFGFKGLTLKMLCTDIDTKALSQARAGTYTQLEVGRGMPVMSLMNHFNQDGTSWIIKDHLKKDIEYRQWNLMESLFTTTRYDMVLCRNVLIYFDKEGKEKVLSNIFNVLADDGILFVGGSESLIGLNHDYTLVQVGKSFGYGKPDTKALLSA